jgi:hypothetical protein
MAELHNCRSCIFNYVINAADRHDCTRFGGAIKVRDPAAQWTREQAFDENGLPRASADGCPGWLGLADDG